MSIISPEFCGTMSPEFCVTPVGVPLPPPR